MTLPQAMIIIPHDDEFLADIATRYIRLDAARFSEADACFAEGIA